MNMKNKVNIHKLKSTRNMKSLEKPGENHTVIHTRKLIQLQT